MDIQKIYDTNITKKEIGILFNQLLSKGKKKQGVR